MGGEDMPPPARGCLTVGKAGVFGTHCNNISENRKYYDA